MRSASYLLVAALFSMVACSGNPSVQAPVPPRSADGAVAAREAPIPCSEISTIRALHRSMNYVKDPATGDTMEYLVLGDGAVSGDVLVMFPGTGQIMTGWPIQMITNSTYSPRIVTTFGYRKSEDGSVSLCHDYRMVLFDYPGVGLSPYEANATRDAVARDVDAMLQDVASRYGISTDTVDPVGWSLGTTYALKYAFLSPVSRPSRTIHNVLLVAGHGGGADPSSAGSDAAGCVATLLGAATTASPGPLDNEIKGDATKLVFPYEGQQKNQNGTNSGCTASVGTSSVTLNVTLQCTVLNGCSPFIANALESFETPPWLHTKGIDQHVYDQQRQVSNDWNVAYCAKALPGFSSSECTAYGSIDQSITNGGVCHVDTTNANSARPIRCAALSLSGKVHLVAGFQDLFIQWTYGKALVDGLNATRSNTADYTFFKGSAGHGVLIQHPRWTQAQLYAGMQGS